MIKSIAEFSLQFTSVPLNLLVSFLKVSEARLLQDELILHFFEFLHRRCLLKLVKESAHLHDGAGLPLFQLVEQRAQCRTKHGVASSRILEVCES